MPKLKRVLGLKELTAYGVGIILGAGIYALIGKAAAIAGNSLWLSFFVGAILASITALSYVELGTMYPKEAAEFVYSLKAFKNRMFAFMTGWLTIALGMVAGATVALGFGGYLQSLTGFPLIVGAALLVIACGLINFWGIGQSAKLNVIFTVIEVIGLLMIIVLGFSYFGSVDYFEMPNGVTGVFTAAALIFFAYVGFEDMVNMSEEVKNPRKVLPKAFVLAIVITTLIYILVSIAAVSIMPWNELGASNAPLADVAERAMPGSSWALSIIALFATANTVLIILIVSSRMVWGMARDKSLPKIFAKIHKKRRTPWVAILLVTLIALLFLLTSAIVTIASVVDLIVFVVFIIVNASLIALRYSKPKARRPFKVPLNIGKFPVLSFLAILISCYMIYHITHIESIAFLYFGLLVLLGIVIYFLKSKL